MTITETDRVGAIPETYQEWTPSKPITRVLTCGHSIGKKDHAWTTRNGADACRQECANRLEQRGR